MILHSLCYQLLITPLPGGVCFDRGVGDWPQNTRKALTFHFTWKNKDVVKQRGNIFNDLKSCILVLNLLLSIFLVYLCLTASTCSCLGDVLSGIFPPILLLPHFLTVQTSFLSVYLGHLFMSGYTDVSSKSSTVFYCMYSHSTLVALE